MAGDWTEELSTIKDMLRAHFQKLFSFNGHIDLATVLNFIH